MSTEKKQNNNETVAAIAKGERKRWIEPTVERQGSVAELVQICKISGGNDICGKRHW